VTVVARISQSTVAKLLVSVDGAATVEEFACKVRKALVRHDIDGTLVRLTNIQGAHLPNDETCTDVLRDGEEVIAVLIGPTRLVPEISRAAPPWASPESLVPEISHALAPGGGNIMNSPRPARVERAAEVARGGGGGHPAAAAAAEPPVSALLQYCPGPAEAFEEDVEDLSSSKFAQAPLSLSLPPSTDWNVEGLSPKLREFISARFKEASTSAANPGHTYILVTMRPHAHAGAMSAPRPIHYSIARVDVIEFERLCALKIEETRGRTEHFQRCREVLKTLLDKGASEAEYAPTMLPYRYRPHSEFKDLLSEADLPIFGQAEGFRPMLIIDTSANAGESVACLRASLKRMLYSFMVAKSKFNLVRFSPKGAAVAWANGMVPPTAQVLREAEDWLDSLKPVRVAANLLDGINLALAHPEADSVYLLSSGLPNRCAVDSALRSVRSMNLRELPMHILGIDCDARAELDLRRLAEENRGSFRQKRFTNVPAASALVASHATGSELCGSEGNHDDAKLTIGGQLNILDVMMEEQEADTVEWLEEQKCATRLLFATATQQGVPDADEAKAAFKKASMRDWKQQIGQGPPRLQELLEAGSAGKPPATRPRSANTMHGQNSRRGLKQSAQRSGSQPRAEAAAAVEALRRPSTANPWDRAGAPVRVSQLANADRAGRASLPRPGSARRSLIQSAR